MPRATDAGAPTRVHDAVARAAAVLAAAGIPEAKREAADMLAALRDAPRFWAATHADEPLGAAERAALEAAAARRAAGAPFAYAVGRAAFRHLTLLVDERVLIPRVETEQLVQLVLDEMAATPGGTAIDLGTGSGAIALSLATEGTFDRVIATDVSTAALEVARTNAARLLPTPHSPPSAERRAPSAEPLEFVCGTWLSPVAQERARVVVSNPPYIAYDEAPALPPSVRDWEPAVALFAADSGMRGIACIIREAPAVVEAGGLLALEIDARRASLAAELALADGRWRDVSVRLDLAGRERFLMARRSGR